MKFYKNIFKRGKSIFLLSTLSLFSFFGFLIVQENANKSDIKIDTFNSELEDIDIDNYEKIIYKDTTKSSVSINKLEYDHETESITIDSTYIPQDPVLNEYAMFDIYNDDLDKLIGKYYVPVGENQISYIWGATLNTSYTVEIWTVGSSENDIQHDSKTIYTEKKVINKEASVSINKLAYDYEIESIMVNYTYIPQDPIFYEYAMFDVYNDDLGKLEAKYQHIPIGENQIFYLNEDTLGVPISSDTNYTIDLWTVGSNEHNIKNDSKTIYTEEIYINKESSVSINKLAYDYKRDGITVNYTYIPQNSIFQEYARFDVYNNDSGKLEAKYQHIPTGENQILYLNEETLGVPISSDTNYTIDIWTVGSNENNNKHASKTIYTENASVQTNGISWWIWVLISLGTISAIIFGLYILKKFTNWKKVKYFFGG